MVDHLLCNITDSQIIVDFKILDFNEFSDHSPVYYTLLSKLIHSEVIHDDVNRTDCSQNLVYDEARLPIFRNQLPTCTAVLNELTENLNNNQIDSVVQHFTSVLFDCTSAAFSRSAHPTNKAMAKNAWFDNNRAEASNSYKQARNLFLRNKSDTNRSNFVSMRTRYNKIKIFARKKTKSKKKAGRFLHWQKKQPNFFWENHQEKLKKKAQQSEKITITDLFDHFKSISGEDENRPRGPRPTCKP